MGSRVIPFAGNGADFTFTACPCRRTTVRRCEPNSTSPGHAFASRRRIMGRIRSLLIPGVDKKLLVKDAAKLMPDLSGRRCIAGGPSLGALTFLTGCDVSDSF